jgi:hypothetical protein
MRSRARVRRNSHRAVRAARGPSPLAGSSVHRHRLPPLAAGLAVAAIAALSACAPNNTPTSYNEVTANSFMLACTGEAPDNRGTTTTLAGSGYCTCAYAVFVDNVPYDADDQAFRVDDGGQLVFAAYSGKTYLQYNAEMANDPNIVPESIVAKLETCESRPGTPAAPSSDAGAGHTAPG